MSGSWGQFSTRLYDAKENSKRGGGNLHEIGKGNVSVSFAPRVESCGTIPVKEIPNYVLIFPE